MNHSERNGVETVHVGASQNHFVRGDTLTLLLEVFIYKLNKVFTSFEGFSWHARENSCSSLNRVSSGCSGGKAECFAYPRYSQTSVAAVRSNDVTW